MSTATGGNFSAYLDRADRKFWLIAAFLALVVPPAGVILAAYLLIRVFKGRQGQGYLLVSLLLFALSLAGAGAYWRLYAYTTSEHYRHTYTALEEFKLPGNQNPVKDGLSILKPKEFVEISNDQAEKNSALMVHYSSQDTKAGSIASLYVGSESDNEATKRPDYSTYVSEVGKILSSSPSTDKNAKSQYDNYKKFFSDYLESFTPQNLDIDLGNPTPLKTANITNNAWELDFTGKASKKNQDYKAGEPVVQGNLIVAFGDRAYYYVIIQSIEYNWERNQATWQKMLDSLKIDQ